MLNQFPIRRGFAYRYPRYCSYNYRGRLFLMPLEGLALGSTNNRVLGAVNVGSRLVEGAWNILRVIVEQDRFRLWLNPTFADVTGASVPPADSTEPPHPPKPLIDVNLTTRVQRRHALSATTTQASCQLLRKFQRLHQALAPPQLHPRPHP